MTRSDQIVSKTWRLAPLGTVCDVIGGGTPSKEVSDYYGGDIPWATVRDMKSDVLASTEYCITQKAVDSSSTNVIKAGNVIIATRVGLGKVCLLGQDTAINQDLRAIIPKGDGLIIKYLYHWLRSIAPKIIQEGTGATVQGVKLPFVKGLQIPLPPVIEQKRIVALLDEALEGAGKIGVSVKRSIQQVDDLFAAYESLFFEGSGNENTVRPLSEVCEVLNGFAFKSNDAIEHSNTQLLRMGNLYKNQLDLDRSPVFYPDSYASTYQRYLLAEGDLVMSLTGTTGKTDYGYTVRVPHSQHQLLLNQRIAKLSAIRSNIADGDYLLYFLRSRTFLNALYRTANGTRQANLSSTTINNLPIPLPDLHHQRSIVAALDDIKESLERLKNLWIRKTQAIDELKQSLLNFAFSDNL